MNILILSPGRRVEVVEYFKDVFHKNEGKVFTLDMSEYAPALYFGDAYFRIDKDFNRLDKYISDIIEICEKNNISSVISLIDPELSLLAEYRERFAAHGVQIICSDLEFTNSTFDKYSFYSKYRNTIKLVETVDNCQEAKEKLESGEWAFPLFAKLRDGSASIGIRKIEHFGELEEISSNDKYIYQPFVKGSEYGVDVYFDLISGELVSAFIKRKLAMRAGETDKSVSVINQKILDEILKIQNIPGIRGTIDVDVFVTDEGEIFINEINPRFGGGYPHAYRCGVNFMQLIHNNLVGIINEKQLNNYKEGEVLLKYNYSILRT